MRLAVVAAFAALCVPPYAGAQKLDLKFDALAARASHKVEFDFDGKLLKLLAGLTKDAELDGLLAGVQAIHVRVYEFARDGEYSPAVLDPLRSQVSGQPKWSKLLTATQDGAVTEIYLAAQGDKVGGCLILSAEARGVHVIHLEGTLSLAQMKRLADEDVRHGLDGLWENR
jgi:hypothetical protein